jgi:hypothetical protein
MQAFSDCQTISQSAASHTTSVIITWTPSQSSKKSHHQSHSTTMAHLLTRAPLRIRAPIFQGCRRQYTIHGPAQPLANSPPVVRPAILDRNVPTAHAPQTAGPKPPPPIPTREKPKLRPTKAALTLVSRASTHLLL